MKRQDQEVIASILHELGDSLRSLLNHFDVEGLNQVVKICLDCHGVLFFTGVGKSGVIARKIVTTLTSLGTRAVYLSAQDALHGDVGVVSQGDLVFLLSKSGESDELIHLCPALRNKNAFLIAVVSQPSSRLSKACDFSFILPRLKELCPFDLIPTTSTLSQLIFGDILAISLMRLKGISLDDFLQNHPGGRIGRQELLHVSDLMVQEDRLPKVLGKTPVVDTLHELSSKQCGCLFIVDEGGHLLGIFTDGDLRRAIQKYNQEVFSKPIEALMTRTPRSISPKEKAKEAMRRMEEDQKRPITVLAVVDDQTRLIGALRLHDLIQSGI